MCIKNNFITSKIFQSRQYCSTYNYHSRWLTGENSSARPYKIVNNMNFPPHVRMCETVVVYYVRPCCIRSHFQCSWFTCKNVQSINNIYQLNGLYLFIYNQLTPGLTEPRVSMLHLQTLFSNPYAELSQSNSSYRHLFLSKYILI